MSKVRQPLDLTSELDDIKRRLGLLELKLHTIHQEKPHKPKPHFTKGCER